MSRVIYKLRVIVICFLITTVHFSLDAQHRLYGVLVDELLNESLIGANVIIQGTTTGTSTDWDGSFSLTVESLPITLEFSYTGYKTLIQEISTADDKIKIQLKEDAIIAAVIEVRGQRVSDKQKSAPLTIESLDLIAIKETPSENFYDGLGSLKGVDLTSASLGFKIINTRGFNSTSPVRTLQLIDGVDNQSPGFNFSLGNFLGSSELDVLKVDIIQGASTAFYGPNAFNGVINMTTKDPFFHKGVAFSGKVAERNLYSGAFRYADAFANKDGFDVFAFKVNAFYLRADDWLADNLDPVDGTDDGVDNPGGYDAVNRYGDEFTRGDETRNFRRLPGLNRYYRTGYEEIDLVDTDRDGDIETENTKASASFHFRLKPSQEYESPELILASSFGGGTTVYQGENRFSLRDIKFYQHRLEIKKKNKWFWRTYATHEDAGKSYDPFFTALKLQDRVKENGAWNGSYTSFYNREIVNRLTAMEGFPDFVGASGGDTDINALNAFLAANQDSLLLYHQLSRVAADLAFLLDPNTADRLVPGTPEFEEAFNDITSRIPSDGGTQFFDKSALIHSQAEYNFDNIYNGDKINNIEFKIGVSGRTFLPNSQGSILIDTSGRNIDTWEYGIYSGATMSFNQNKMKLSLTGRYDDHENFDPNFSPAVSWVYTPSSNNFLRVSFSSAVRNPTLADQYLNYNVGPAILRGNIGGFNDLFPVDEFVDFLNNQDVAALEASQFDVDPIRTEKVRTFEVGYRTTLFKSLYLDAGYYYSDYDDFIGFQLGITANIVFGLPNNTQVYRVSTNASQDVTTQGFSIGYNYYFARNYAFNGNYSWNKLNSEVDDPIIPAFNTPEHKFNVGFSGRDLIYGPIRNIGFNINYKWIEGFIFEGSPQFTGFIPSYALMDAQINWRWARANTTFKVGASNILNDKNFQTYGGPRVGRLGYFKIVYDWKKD